MINKEQELRNKSKKVIDLLKEAEKEIPGIVKQIIETPSEYVEVRYELANGALNRIEEAVNHFLRTFGDLYKGEEDE